MCFLIASQCSRSEIVLSNGHLSIWSRRKRQFSTFIGNAAIAIRRQLLQQAFGGQPRNHRPRRQVAARFFNDSLFTCFGLKHFGCHILRFRRFRELKQHAQSRVAFDTHQALFSSLFDLVKPKWERVSLTERYSNFGRKQIGIVRTEE